MPIVRLVLGFCAIGTLSFAACRDDVGSSGNTSSTALEAPANLIASETLVDAIELHWNAVSNAAVYDIYKGYDQNGMFFLRQADVIENTFVDTPVDCLERHPYYVIARAEGSKDSPPSDIVVGKTTAPKAGPLLASDGSYTDRVVLSWDAVARVERYRLESAGAPEGPFATLTTTTELGFVHNGLDENSSHYYRLIALVEGFVDGPPSEWALGRTGLGPPDLTFDSYFKSENTAPTNWYGSAVALSADGTTLAVGEMFTSTVYVYVRGTGVWALESSVKAPLGAVGDQFGAEISLSADGNILAVGAETEDSEATGVNGNEADDSMGDSGAAYVFVRGGSVWTQQAYLKASNTGPGDAFGSAVRLSADGGTLAIGAFREASSATGVNNNQSDNTFGSAGAVYVFVKNGSVWQQEAYLKASNTAEHDMFGSGLILSADGNTLVVGAHLEDSGAIGIDGDQGDDEANSDSGAAYVFVRSGNIWTQEAYLKPMSYPVAGGMWGLSLALSADGNRLVVGGYLGSDIYDRSGGTWTFEASGAFGVSDLALSSDGNLLAVGIDWESSDATGINGDPNNTNRVKSGAAYLFARTGNVWGLPAYIKAPNAGANDCFGRSIALSTNGNALVVGAFGEASNATGINGNPLNDSMSLSGAAYTYIIP